MDQMLQSSMREEGKVTARGNFHQVEDLVEESDTLALKIKRGMIWQEGLRPWTASAEREVTTRGGFQGAFTAGQTSLHLLRARDWGHSGFYYWVACSEGIVEDKGLWRGQLRGVMGMGVQVLKKDMPYVGSLWCSKQAGIANKMGLVLRPSLLPSQREALLHSTQGRQGGSWSGGVVGVQTSQNQALIITTSTEK